MCVARKRMSFSCIPALWLHRVANARCVNV